KKLNKQHSIYIGYSESFNCSRSTEIVLGIFSCLLCWYKFWMDRLEHV
ncbi:hypothetical protein Taro_044380, partial [Colocasia esculenta]|nr:hypothetical protein [Colocasia esculenta]